MKYYLQIVKDNVSILVDSDVGYHHHFKIDDVIEVVMDDNLGVSLNIHGCVIQNPIFTVIQSAIPNGFTIASVVMKGYMIDITKEVERNRKLDELGIKNG